MNSVHQFPDPEGMAEAMARRLRDEAQQAVRKNCVYSIVLSGGTTAAKVYSRFAITGFGHQIPWKVVHLFWADERCVPPESGESNFGTARRAFLDLISIPEENVHRIRGEDDPAAESVRYAREIQDHQVVRNSKIHFFDQVFLGLGPDGHTASLFPDQEILLRSTNLCEVARHPVSGQKRITLTPFALQRSARITYHVIGNEKAGIVSELISNSPPAKNYPAENIPGEWFLDQAAASGLKLS